MDMLPDLHELRPGIAPGRLAGLARFAAALLLFAGVGVSPYFAAGCGGNGPGETNPRPQEKAAGVSIPLVDPSEFVLSGGSAGNSDEEPAPEPAKGADPPAGPVRVVLEVTSSTWREDEPMDVEGRIRALLAGAGVTIVEDESSAAGVVHALYDEEEGAEFDNGGTGTNILFELEVRPKKEGLITCSMDIVIEPALQFIETTDDPSGDLYRAVVRDFEEDERFELLGPFTVAALGNREALVCLLPRLWEQTGHPVSSMVEDLLEATGFEATGPREKACLAIYEGRFDDLPKLGKEAARPLLEFLGLEELREMHQIPRFDEVKAAVRALEKLSPPGVLQTYRELLGWVPPSSHPPREGDGQPLGEDESSLEERGEAVEAILDGVAKRGERKDLFLLRGFRDLQVAGIDKAAGRAEAALWNRLGGKRAGSGKKRRVRFDVKAWTWAKRRFDIQSAMENLARSAGLEIAGVEDKEDGVVEVEYAEFVDGSARPPDFKGKARGEPTRIRCSVAVYDLRRRTLAGPVVLDAATSDHPGADPDFHLRAVAALKAKGLFPQLGRFIAAALGDAKEAAFLVPRAFEWGLAGSARNLFDAVTPELETEEERATLHLLRHEFKECASLAEPARAPLRAYLESGETEGDWKELAALAALAAKVATAAESGFLLERLDRFDPMDREDLEYFPEPETERAKRAMKEERQALCALLRALGALGDSASRKRIERFARDGRREVAGAASKALKALSGGK